MLQRYLLIWLCLSSWIAYCWDGWFADTSLAANNPFLASKPYLMWLIAVAMFAIGWMLPRDEVQQVARRWPAVILGTALQYTSMPLLGWAMARLFQLDEATAVGVIMAGCVPGAMASNVLTLVARGNVSYSVGLTTLATLLSPIVVPLALRMTLDKSVPFQSSQASIVLALMVVVPVILGFVLSRFAQAWQDLVGKIGSTVANLSILWIIAVVVADNRERLQLADARMLAALIGLNVLGYLAGYVGGKIMRLPESMKRALTLEIGMQNAGLGTALILQLFRDNPEMQAAAIPTAIYTFGCMLTGTMLARFWASYGNPAGDVNAASEGA